MSPDTEIVAGGTIAEVDPGDALVAVQVSDDGRDAVPCPAAPLLFGELARRGLRPVGGQVDLLPAGSAEAVAGMAAYALPGTGSQAWAMGVAVGRPGRDRAAVLDALRAWAPARRPRTVLLAAPRAFCAGVERAIEAVERALDQRGAPVYVRRQIVHNAHVVRGLAERGAVFVDELDQVPDGALVLFSAHGVSPAVRAEAARRGLE